MGWAYGINSDGRNVGYGVPATCDQKHCYNKIDRGLGFCCGNMHDGGEWGCGGYFCGKHLSVGPGRIGQLCVGCTDYVYSLRCTCGHTWNEHGGYSSTDGPDDCCNDTECLCETFDLADEFERREVPV